MVVPLNKILKFHPSLMLQIFMYEYLILFYWPHTSPSPFLIVTSPSTLQFDWAIVYPYRAGLPDLILTYSPYIFCFI